MFCPTYLAVIKVLSYAFAFSAYSTVGTVIDLLLAAVVPELANIAVITGSHGLTESAVVRCSLW